MSSFPHAYILDCDEGHSGLESMRFAPTCWEDIIEFYDWVVGEIKAKRWAWDQIVIDTITTFFLFGSQYVSKKHNVAHEGMVDYGKATSELRGMIRNMLLKFRNLGLGVIFVAHSKQDKDDEGKWKPSLEDEKSVDLLNSLADITFFFGTRMLKGEKQHYILTEPTGKAYAKCRFNGLFPREMACDYEAYKANIIQFNKAHAAKAKPAKKDQPKEEAPPSKDEAA